MALEECDAKLPVDTTQGHPGDLTIREGGRNIDCSHRKQDGVVDSRQAGGQQPSHIHEPEHALIPQDDPLGEIKKPNPNDVLLGKGRRGLKQSGNKKVREFVEAAFAQYWSANTKKKNSIAREIVTKIPGLEPPGRFLRLRDDVSKSSDEVTWVIAEENKVRDFVMQLFRTTKKMKKEDASNLSPGSGGDQNEHPTNAPCIRATMAMADAQAAQNNNKQLHPPRACSRVATDPPGRVALPSDGVHCVEYCRPTRENPDPLATEPAPEVDQQPALPAAATAAEDQPNGAEVPEMFKNMVWQEMYARANALRRKNGLPHQPPAEAVINDKGSAEEQKSAQAQQTPNAGPAENGKVESESLLIPQEKIDERTFATSDPRKSSRRASRTLPIEETPVNSGSGQRRKMHSTAPGNNQDSSAWHAPRAFKSQGDSWKTNATTACRASPRLLKNQSQAEGKPIKDKSTPHGSKKVGTEDSGATKKRKRQRAKPDGPAIEQELAGMSSDKACGENCSSEDNEDNAVVVEQEISVRPRQPASAERNMRRRMGGSHVRSNCECLGCRVMNNCGNCVPCRDSIEFGGPGKLQRICVHRRCSRTRKRQRVQEQQNPPDVQR